ncbi:hypothetical protein [Bradyrhizobium sp. LjRoot220]|uniref:hypothetical protein n=1 Tax=Bradyrhizobium sp. LjRoot220 TaxID=3342284 RepID=UPI003F4FBEA7
MMIAATACDLNEVEFVSRNVEWMEKSPKDQAVGRDARWNETVVIACDKREAFALGAWRRSSPPFLCAAGWVASLRSQ